MEISLPVALAVLGAALLHAGWNAFLKSGEDKQLDSIGIAVGSGAVALLAAPFAGLPASASWPWLAASALVHIAYFRLLAGASMRDLVRPHVLFVIFGWIQHRARLEQRNADTEVGEHLHHGSPAGSRTDDDNIVNRSGSRDL